MTSIRQAYLDVAESAAQLLREPAVAAAWAAPSSLPDFSVGGLAGHLAWQILCVPIGLDADVPDGRPLTLAEHYERGAWIDAHPTDPVHIRIRTGGEELGAGGPAALIERVDTAVGQSRGTLPGQSGDRVVHLPWSGWSLRLDDLLTTRMMELAVHSDDLAMSVDLPTPPLPDGAHQPVLGLLAQLAVRRHGPTAVVRAFSRPDRAPESIAAF